MTRLTDGFWKTAQEYTISYPEQVYSTKTDDSVLTVYAARTTIQSRGQTLQGPLFTIQYRAPFPGIIQVTVTHYEGTDPERLFQLQRDPSFQPEITDTPESCSLSSGPLKVELDKKGKFCARFTYNGKFLTQSGWHNTAYAKERPSYAAARKALDADCAFWQCPTPQGNTFFREQLQLQVGENLYGLGEQFTPFAKNGQETIMYNGDGGTNSQMAYKNIPFFLSNRGYGVLVDDSGPVEFSLAAENVSHAQFITQGESLQYYIIAGDTPKEAVSRYCLLTGKPALPPAWSFGLWLSTSFTTSYDEKTVSSFLDGMSQRDIPLQVFHFDCFWMEAFHWCDFRWDPVQFPDPEGMLRRLKSRGLKICVWINPYISQCSALFQEGAEKGYFLKKQDGSIYQCDEWQPGMAFVDFTNPNACKWYQEKLSHLLDMGVDCFKTDFGERIPFDAVYSNGADPLKMHNYYSCLYNQTVFSLLENRLGKGQAAVFARSATAGGQQFPVHWGGDCSATYQSMAETLRGGLSLACCGFGFWSHDISGFENTATPDIYKRWAAFGLLSTHSRLHGSSSYRVPWLFDEESVDVVHFFVRLKGSLMPYLYSQAKVCAETGIPVMRPMFMEFPRDPGCLPLDRQYMLGDSLLAAPVFSEDGTAEWYLPDGRWTHLLSGKTVDGGRFFRETFDYFSLPLFVRENSILPIGDFQGDFVYNYIDGVILNLFEIQDHAFCKLCGADGDVCLTADVQRADGKISVRLDGQWEKVFLCLRGVSLEKIAEVKGASCKDMPEGVRVAPETNCLMIFLK